MRFHALVGVLPHERVYPQPLEVDVTVWRAAPSDEAPDDDAVIDYRDIYDAVAARVAVRKPHVPLPGPLAYAEVVVDSGRPQGDA